MIEDSMPTRRRVLTAALGALGASVLSSPVLARPETLYVTGGRRRDGVYTANLIDKTGRIALIHEAPGRMHDAAIAPDNGTVVLFARRPGRFALIIDVRRKRVTGTLPAREDRHFYGHGVFSRDGRLLYASENDFEAGDGVIGVYDAASGYRRIGEFSSGGIGPHELILSGDGQTVIVANGGILTHPDYGRRKLNIADMKPSLAYLDARSGKLVEQQYLPDAFHKLSIRHIATTRNGVWFGGQSQGAHHQPVPLIGRHTRGQKIQLLSESEGFSSDFRNYVGSVRANRPGTKIAATSPRGNRFVIFHAQSGAIVAQGRLRDACGVAASDGDGFLVSGGSGRLLVTDQKTRTVADQGWDNHLRRVT